MNEILVTGHTGFIGRQVTSELLKRGYNVCGVSLKRTLPSQKGLRQINLNLLSENDRKLLFEHNKFEKMIHLAWYVGAKCHTSNVNIHWLTASIHLLNLFHQSGGKTFQANGTVSEYDFNRGYMIEDDTFLNNQSLHGQCKSALYKVAKQYCLQNGIIFKWSRCFNLYGPYERSSRLMPSVIQAALLGEDIKVSDCQKFQDYLHVYDTASAIVDIFESNITGAINVSSCKPVQLRYIVELIADLTNFKGNILWGAYASNFDAPIIVGDNQKLTHLVGWTQKIQLKEGLHKTIKWWKNNV